MAEITKQATLVTLREGTDTDPVGDGVRISRGRFLDELPGAVFAAITLVWIVMAFASLIRIEVPAHLIDHARAMIAVVLGSSLMRMVSHGSFAVSLVYRVCRFVGRRKTDP